MRRTLPALALLGLPALSGCAPTVSPPGRADASFGLRVGQKAAPIEEPKIKTTTTRPGQDTAGATIFRLSAGAHLASAFPNRQLPVDAGAGYVFTDVGMGERKIHGFYGEFMPLATAGTWWRLYAGFRGEALLPDVGKKTGFTALGRMGVESFSPVSVVGSDEGPLVVGGAHGVYGIGAFVEAGGQKLPGGEQAYLVMGGVSGRFPASLGFLMFVK